MNKNFLFFIVASALFILSIITINLAPIINGSGEIETSSANNNVFEGWNIANCQKDEDDYKFKKERGDYNSDTPLET